MLPSGYRVRLEKQIAGTAWRLVGTRAARHPVPQALHRLRRRQVRNLQVHRRACSSRALSSSSDYHSDMEQVAGDPRRGTSRPSTGIALPMNARGRPILSPERSLGSVIKLLTPSRRVHRRAQRTGCAALPQTIRQLVFTVKRYYRPEWGDNWREHFTVDRINGFLGHELKFDNQKLVSNYLRVGYDPDGSWRIYKLRPDFHPADKVQVEDDITASRRAAAREPDRPGPGVLATPASSWWPIARRLLFQRPDDAIHPRRRQAGRSRHRQPGTFLSNFEPLTREQARTLVDHVVEFDQYHRAHEAPAASDFVEAGDRRMSSPPRTRAWSTASPRRIRATCRSGPDLVNPRDTYLAEIGARLVPRDSRRTSRSTCR